MRLKEAINKRKSIRCFENKKIPKSMIKDAVKAPSSGNRQPWIFYCVDSKKTRDKVSELLRETLKLLKNQMKLQSKKIQKITKEFYSDLGGAQNIIFIYRKKIKNEAVYAKPSDIKSISCAAENLMLSAVNMGLGTCWVGSFNGKPEKKLNKILKTKNNEELVASIIIGYPKKEYQPLKRKKKQLKEVLKFR